MPHRLVLPRGAVRLVRGLVDQLRALHDDTGPTSARDDHPAWRRLYPATTADPRLDATLRDLVHPDLVEGRREALELVASALDAAAPAADESSGGEQDSSPAPVQDVHLGLGATTEVVELDDVQASALLGVVNDIRLALAATVDLPALLDDDDRLRDDVPDETRGVVELVEWLAVVQEQVLASLAPVAQAHFQDPVHERRGETGPDAGTDAGPVI